MGVKWDFTKRPHEYATKCGTLVRNIKAQEKQIKYTRSLNRFSAFCKTTEKYIYIFKKSYFNGKTCTWRDPQQAWRVNPEVMHAGGNWLDEFPMCIVIGQSVRRPADCLCVANTGNIIFEIHKLMNTIKLLITMSGCCWHFYFSSWKPLIKILKMQSTSV